MPCHCFGGPKKDSKNLKEPPYDYKKVPSNLQSSEKVIVPVKSKDVESQKTSNPSHVDSQKATGSELSANLVDSPVSDSRTPSTAPAGASSKNSSLTGSPPASPNSVRGALRRAELAQKRREFFKDLMDDDPFYRQRHTNGTATLPTAAMRARNFGDVKIVRPSSQPNSLMPSPTNPPSAPPPGPHLLRPASPNLLPKVDTSSTFTTPGFLNELRDASEEISRRWQMTDEERDITPCALKNKIHASPQLYDQRAHSPHSNATTVLEFKEKVTTNTSVIVTEGPIVPSSEAQITNEVNLLQEPSVNVGSAVSSCSVSPPGSPEVQAVSPSLAQLGPNIDITEALSDLHSNSSQTDDIIFDDQRLSDSELEKHLISDDEQFEREILEQYEVTEPGLQDFPIDGRNVFDESDLHDSMLSSPLSNLEVIPEVTQFSEDEHAELSADPTPSPIETGSISSENSDALKPYQQDQHWNEDTVPLIEDHTPDHSGSPTPVQSVESNENHVKTIK